jgi:DNA-binding transcriptional regulator YbjK
MLVKRKSSARLPAETRRDEILGATLQVVSEAGSDGVTFRRVAAVSGVPLGLITYYFRSREDLLREAFRLYIDRAITFISSIGEGKPARSAQGVIDGVLEFAGRVFSEDSTMVRLEYELILYAARDPALAREFNDHERRIQTGIAASLEALGAPRPIDAARTIIDQVRGFEIERLTQPNTGLEALERRIRLVVDAVVNARPTRRARRARESNRRRTSVS